MLARRISHLNRIVAKPAIITPRTTISQTHTALRSFSAMAAKPIPVIICGRHAEIAKAVAGVLHPEYEMVHFVSSPEGGVKDLPRVLGGKEPETGHGEVGTGNVGAGAAAVIVGGGYGDSDYEALHKAVEEAGLERRPVWLRRGDATGLPPPGPEYGKVIAVRVKNTLDKLGKEGRMDGSDGGTYLF